MSKLINKQTSLSDDTYTSTHVAPSLQGYLHKKSPSGIFGRHLWQKRWVTLDGECMAYWKEKKEMVRGEKPIGKGKKRQNDTCSDVYIVVSFV